MVHQRLIRTKRGIRVDIESLPPDISVIQRAERARRTSIPCSDYGVGDKGHEHERTGELTVKAALATAAKAAATDNLVENCILICVVGRLVGWYVVYKVKRKEYIKSEMIDD